MKKTYYRKRQKVEIWELNAQQFKDREVPLWVQKMIEDGNSIRLVNHNTFDIRLFEYGSTGRLASEGNYLVKEGHQYGRHDGKPRVRLVYPIEIILEYESEDEWAWDEF